MNQQHLHQTVRTCCKVSCGYRNQKSIHGDDIQLLEKTLLVHGATQFVEFCGFCLLFCDIIHDDIVQLHL